MIVELSKHDDVSAITFVADRTAIHGASARCENMLRARLGESPLRYTRAADGLTFTLSAVNSILHVLDEALAPLIRDEGAKR